MKKILKEVFTDAVLIGLWCLIVAAVCIIAKVLIDIDFAVEVVGMMMILGIGCVLIGVIVDMKNSQGGKK